MFVHQYGLKHYVQLLLCTLREIRDYAGLHPVREIRKLAIADTVDYICSNMPNAIGCYSGREVLDIALQNATLDGHFLEFGVYRGGTLRHIAKTQPKKPIHGFDSFEGLPETWAGARVKKVSFDRKGRLPKVPANVQLHVGWFDTSLPQWLATNEGPISFLHIDCDLYASCKTIFDLAGPRLGPGTVIVFDEYFGYHRWREHEFKAFQEFCAASGIIYEYLAYARDQVAVRIQSVDQSRQPFG